MDLHSYLSSSSTTAALAAALGVPAPLVTQWKNGARQVPSDRAVQIERVTAGRLTCDVLRSDLKWIRIADAAWPHPEGRPVLDLWPELTSRPDAPKEAA